MQSECGGRCFGPGWAGLENFQVVRGCGRAFGGTMEFDGTSHAGMFDEYELDECFRPQIDR